MVAKVANVASTFLTNVDGNPGSPSFSSSFVREVLLLATLSNALKQYLGECLRKTDGNY